MIRIASVPASHVYVRHLSDPDGADEVTRLADPVPADGRTVPGGWWPPLMLEPGWVTANHHRFDAFHVHFGFDAIGPQVLSDVVGELKAHGKPIVYTVHDLRNPHHAEADAHVAQQDVLVAAADELITLTPGAADRIHQRWDRHARVLPHPHVLERPGICSPRPRSEHFVVGVHLKSLRANMDPLPVLRALAGAVKKLPDARLQINVHDEIFDPSNHWYSPEIGQQVLDFRRHDDVRVVVHPYFDDAQLWDYLSRLTVSVLPYRFGTHSGWLEACFDLGTAVVAPTCGFYGEQSPCRTFEFTETSFDEDSLIKAVDAAHADWRTGAPPPRATWRHRHGQRLDLAAQHRQIYERILR